MSLNVEVLEQSFERVKPHATEFASSFYNNLLTDYPQLRPLFANTTMEEQEKKLMMSLVLVIENLRNLGYLTIILKQLGERHVRYGTMKEHYPMVGAALLKTFESYLGTDWTPEVKQAWTDAYGVLVNLMLEGAYPEEISKLENAVRQRATSTVMEKAPTQAPVNVSRVNYSQDISKLESESKQSAKLEITGKAPKQPSATTSSLNLKLLLIIFVVAGLVGVGFLYHHSSSEQDDSRLRSSVEFDL